MKRKRVLREIWKIRVSFNGLPWCNDTFMLVGLDRQAKNDGTARGRPMSFDI
jgi:hypothetical protein